MVSDDRPGLTMQAPKDPLKADAADRIVLFLFGWLFVSGIAIVVSAGDGLTWSAVVACAIAGAVVSAIATTAWFAIRARRQAADNPTNDPST